MAGPSRAADWDTQPHRRVTLPCLSLEISLTTGCFAPQFPELMKWCSRLEEALPHHPSPAPAESRAVQLTDTAPMARQRESWVCQGFKGMQGGDKALPEQGVDALT